MQVSCVTSGVWFSTWPRRDGQGVSSALVSRPRRPCPLGTLSSPPGTPASGVRSARSSGHPAGQPCPPRRPSHPRWAPEGGGFAAFLVSWPGLRGALGTPQVSLALRAVHPILAGPQRAGGLQPSWRHGLGPGRRPGSCGAGRVGWGHRSLSFALLCPQPTRGHGPGRRGDLHQRLRQPPRAAQSPRQGGPGDHGHHQGRWRRGCWSVSVSRLRPRRPALGGT